MLPTYFQAIVQKPTPAGHLARFFRCEPVAHFLYQAFPGMAAPTSTRQPAGCDAPGGRLFFTLWYFSPFRAF